MGAVYRGYDPELDRPVAIKLLRMRREGAHRVVREARALAALSHPNVVQVYDVGLAEGPVVYIVMELIEGVTLRGWLARQPRSCADVLAVLARAGAGLIAAHERGLVHRDFKPTNVMIAHGGAVKVLDFGLARAAASGSPRTRPDDVLPEASSRSIDEDTSAGVIAGTPAYMAPEQAAGAATDAAADQYGFCVALHEALWGVRPGEPLPDAERSKIPPHVRAAIERGLRREPIDRWRSMQALLDALGRRVLAPTRAAFAALVLLASILAVLPSWTLLEDRCDALARHPDVALSDRFTASEEGEAIQALHDRLHALEKVGRTREARAQVERLLASEPSDANSARKATLLRWRGHLLVLDSDLGEAIAVLGEAAHMAHAHRVDWLALWAVSELIPALANHGRYDEARTWVRFGESVLERWDTDARTEAQFEAQVGALHRLQGELEEAGVHLERAVALLDDGVETETLAMGTILTEYGTWLAMTGRSLEARDAHCRAADITADLLGRGVAWVNLQSNCAISTHGVGLVDLAVEQLHEARAILEAEGIEDMRLGLVLLNLAAFELDREDAPAAEGPARRAVAIFDAALPSPHLYHVYARANLAAAILERADAAARAEARAVLEPAAQMAVRLQGPRDPVVGSILVLLAQADLGDGETRAAIRRAEEAVAILGTVASDPVQLAQAELTLAQAIHERDPERAVALARASLARSPPPPLSPLRPRAAAWLREHDAS
jgi:tRNA A-37 threonylcarbamoyl transferase component Bud32/tetratricopeptide (TPR) repeat protein